MKWTKVKSAISDVVPILGGAVGGPAGAIAGRVIASALNTDEDEQSILKALQSDPEAYSKLKRAELEHYASLAQISANDRADARAKNSHSIMPALLCCVMTAAVIAFGGSLLLVQVPDSNIRLIDTLFGSFLTSWLGTVAYWVGTTRGSAEKTNMMSK